MDILQMVVEEGYIMIPALYILAEAIKRTEAVDNKWIPLILIAIGVSVTPFLLGGFTAYNIVQGILVSGAPILAYESIGKMFLNKEQSELNG